MKIWKKNCLLLDAIQDILQVGLGFYFCYDIYSLIFVILSFWNFLNLFYRLV